MSALKEFFVACGTGIDGVSWDIVRVGGGIGLMVFLGLGITHEVMHGVFDPVAFGAGMATIIASIGAGVGFKKGTEPGEKQ